MSKVRLQCPHCKTLTPPVVLIAGDYKCNGCKKFFRVEKRKAEAA